MGSGGWRSLVGGVGQPWVRSIGGVRTNLQREGEIKILVTKGSVPRVETLF